MLRRAVLPLLAALLCCGGPGLARAQEAPPAAAGAKSGKRALALSLLVPGLGHRYVQDGNWRGRATAFALADAGLWLGLFGTEAARRDLVDDYTTLAAARAGALVEGKNREFFLNLATFASSDEYREVMLRNRAWNRVDYVATRSFQWAWEDEADFFAFRGMREDAESLRRRRTVLITVLAANRLLSGLSAIRAAGRTAAGGEDLSLSLLPPPPGDRLPRLRLQARF